MELYSALSDCLARIDAASSAPVVWASVKDFIARLGYTHIVALDLTKLAGGVGGATIYSDRPREQLEAAEREMGQPRHPVIAKLLATELPFLISDLRNAPEHKGKRWPEMLADVVKRGDGVVVPVFAGNELRVGINFAGEKPDTSALARGMLQVLAHAAIDKLNRGDESKPSRGSPTLSVREAQCLRLVAVGQTDIDAGGALGISPRTVRFHIDSAKTKLGVTTRIQAVAKALREKIIAADPN
jgi:DNA-binding CsgD family transcriptional regulator